MRTKRFGFWVGAMAARYCCVFLFVCTFFHLILFRWETKQPTKQAIVKRRNSPCKITESSKGEFSDLYLMWITEGCKKIPCRSELSFVRNFFALEWLCKGFHKWMMNPSVLWSSAFNAPPTMGYFLLSIHFRECHALKGSQQADVKLCVIGK